MSNSVSKIMECSAEWRAEAAEAIAVNIFKIIKFSNNFYCKLNVSI